MLVLIVGESGSGKTTLVDELAKLNEYNRLDSYTTRAPRSENEPGHVFVKDEDYIVNEHKCGMVDILKRDIVHEKHGQLYKRVEHIAYTNFHGSHYWAEKNQYEGKGVTLYVIDPDGVSTLREIVTDTKVLVVYLALDEDTRLRRMLERGDSCHDATDRIEHDKIKFQNKDYDYPVNAAMDKEELALIVDDIVQHEYSKI
jgi:guanylate kinase